MTINEPCNLDVPAGATPMTIADAILRECDKEVLNEVLYYIQCHLRYNQSQELIKCKDCRHFNNGDCTELPKLVSEDDFCSFAERRTE